LKSQETIIVFNLSGQYDQLIARKVREAKVYCEILPFDDSIKNIKEKNPNGIIIVGDNSNTDAERMINKEIFELGIPILGICQGAHLISSLFDAGTVKGSILFRGICNETYADNFPFAAVENNEQKLYGVDFHPETLKTQMGKQIIKNFLFQICCCTGNWTMESYARQSVQSLKEQYEGKKVLCALSGGVDSAVSAVLMHKAIGTNLICIHVDHGLLRKNESDQVEKVFREKFNMNLIRVNAQKRFLNRLKGVIDPELKRKIIGEEFIRVFEEEARKIGGVDYLVQGTIYPDVVESGIGNAAVIKSHHNVGGLPENIKFKGIIEPLRYLFKDEVRQLGEALGIPKELVWRQPFPGPGLGVRVIGEITEEKLEIVREADAIVREEITKAGLDKDIWQYFAILTGMRSVGVRENKRTYDYTVAVRAIVSKDAMTADWAKIPYDVLESISSRIVNEVKNVNRVVYDITGKPPATIEWE